MAARTQVVIDTSITMAWCFEDEADDFADQVLEQLRTDTAVVPALWQLEVTNVLIVAERRKRISEAQASRFVSLLERLPIEVDTDESRIPALLAIGRRHGLSAYDASYLDLAQRLGLPLATLDQQLLGAAHAAGVEVKQRN